MLPFEALSCEFEKNLRDFDRFKPKLHLYNNQMEVNVETQQLQQQLELCELQCDQFLLSRKNATQECYSTLVSKDRFLKLASH